MSREDMRNIECFVFEVRLRDGRKAVYEFHRGAKIRELMTATDPLGDFLTDLVAAAEARPMPWPTSGEPE